jgi:hypothetical protein
VAAATASAVAFLLAILGSLWDPGVKVQIGVVWLAVVVLIAVSAVGTAIKLALDARRSVQPALPRAVGVLVRSAVENDTRPSTTLIMGRPGSSALTCSSRFIMKST